MGASDSGQSSFLPRPGDTPGVQMGAFGSDCSASCPFGFQWRLAGHLLVRRRSSDSDREWRAGRIPAEPRLCLPSPRRPAPLPAPASRVWAAVPASGVCSQIGTSTRVYKAAQSQQAGIAVGLRNVARSVRVGAERPSTALPPVEKSPSVLTLKSVSPGDTPFAVFASSPLPAAALPGTPSVGSRWCLPPCLAPRGRGGRLSCPRCPGLRHWQDLVSLHLPPRGG